MAHAYTPGLRVAERVVIRKRRLLPIPGEVLVEMGQKVDSSAVVARTQLPGKVHTVNVVNLLGVSPEELRGHMLKREGDAVAKEEPLAENRPLIKWFKTQVRSPIAGTIESISEITGQVLLREPPQSLDLRAYVDGRVVEILPDQGAAVEAACSLVQGIFGIGGEVAGLIALAVGSPEEALTPDRIGPEYRGKIVVGGSFADKDTLLKAREMGLSGLVVGGLHDQDLRELLGYDLGVAITGTEKVGFSLILTEGFGRIAMARRTFDLLASKEGWKASMSGATQIRAGVIRPEILVPLDVSTGKETATLDPGATGKDWKLEIGNWKLEIEGDPHAQVKGKREDEEPEGREGMKPGDLVRIIREPYFGAIVRVKALPSQLQQLPTESRVRVLEVELPDAKRAFIPRANVEIIEG